MSPEAQKLLNWIRHGKPWGNEMRIDKFSDNDVMAYVFLESFPERSDRWQVTKKACNELVDAGLLIKMPAGGRRTRSYWVNIQVHHD